jgi:hypothetical protein
LRHSGKQVAPAVRKGDGADELEQTRAAQGGRSIRGRPSRSRLSFSVRSRSIFSEQVHLPSKMAQKGKR